MTNKENLLQNPISILFVGTPGFLGGLSNESELVEKCPDNFKEKNNWSEYAMEIFSKGGSTSNWKWRTDDVALRQKQVDCFYGLISTFNIEHEDKEAVAGWMLSEMLENVPEYPSRKKHYRVIL